MIDALSLNQVGMSQEPDESHQMGDWESTLVSCASIGRFGSVRTCKVCGGIDVRAGGAGSRYHSDEMALPCKPQNCTCKFPNVIFTNGNGHDTYCPCNKTLYKFDVFEYKGRKGYFIWNTTKCRKMKVLEYLVWEIDVSYEGSRALGAHTYIPSLDVHINWAWDKSSEQHEH
jgi:hypothetical protein